MTLHLFPQLFFKQHVIKHKQIQFLVIIEQIKILTVYEIGNQIILEVLSNLSDFQ